MSDANVKDQKEQEFKKYSTPQEELAALQLALVREQLANAKAEAEERELRAEERKYSLADTKQRVEERKIKDLQRQENRQAQGRTFAQQSATESARQRVCTHKKGGTVSPRDMAVLSTGGDGAQYAVLKHRMIDNALWIRCLRCAKTWTPPQKENFYFDKSGKQAPYQGPQAGTFDEKRFKEAELEYMQACAFPTRNGTSSSVMCQFSKWNDETKSWDLALGKAAYQEGMLNTNLR